MDSMDTSEDGEFNFPIKIGSDEDKRYISTLHVCTCENHNYKIIPKKDTTCNCIKRPVLSCRFCNVLVQDGYDVCDFCHQCT